MDKKNNNNNKKRRVGRPIKQSAIGRVQLTTKLQPEIIAKAKQTAKVNGKTLADLLEGVLVNYLKAFE